MEIATQFPMKEQSVQSTLAAQRRLFGYWQATVVACQQEIATQFPMKETTGAPTNHQCSFFELSYSTM
jgi:hypothetical protein